MKDIIKYESKLEQLHEDKEFQSKLKELTSLIKKEGSND